MFANVLNEDCNKIIDGFYSLTSLSTMMMLNKSFNKHGMGLVGMSYEKRLPIAPKTGVFHMGLFLTKRNQAIAKENLIKSLDHSVAALKMRCMLCDKKCPSISIYGFSAHSSCVRKKEANVNGRNSPISWDMVSLVSLKTRELYTGGKTFYAIKEGIPGVFPHSLSMRGYIEDSGGDLEWAREKSTKRLRLAEEKKQADNARIEEQRLNTKAEIENIIGKSFTEWVSEDFVDGWVYHKNKKARVESNQQTNKIPVQFTKYAVMFKRGEDAVEAHKVFQQCNFLCDRMNSIFHCPEGETLDCEKVAKRMQFYIKDHFLKANIEALRFDQSRQDKRRYLMSQLSNVIMY